MSAIQLLEQHKDNLIKLVPQTAQGFSVPDIIRQVGACLQDNQKLRSCSPQSIARATRYAVQLGLNVHGPLRQAYLVPYGNECKFDLQYQGLMELMMRTGLYKKLKAKAVHENDDFKLNSDDSISHSHGLANRGEIVGFYATAQHSNGDWYSEVFTKEEMDYLESTTRKGGGSTPAWKNWYGEMGRKSAIKRLMKWLPKTGGTDMHVIDQAIALDNKQFDAEILEPKKIEQGKAQAAEMESAEAIESATEQLMGLVRDAQEKLDQAAFDSVMETVSKKDLKSIMRSIDNLQSVLAEV